MTPYNEPSLRDDGQWPYMRINTLDFDCKTRYPSYIHKLQAFSRLIHQVLS